MAKHRATENVKRIREIEEFTNHLTDLERRIRVFNIRAMVRSS